MSYSLICEELPTVSVTGVPECPSGFSAQVAVVPFDSSQIDPVIATSLFTGGFTLCLTPWAAAHGLKYLLRLIQYK